MRAIRLLPIAIVLGLLLSACQSKSVDCSNEEGLSKIIAELSKEAEQEIKATNPTATLSVIRAAVNNLDFSIKQVRTSKQDPNSTKIFCEADFVVNIPVKIIEDSEEAMKQAGYNSNVELALEEHGFEISSAAANSYQTTFSYDLQPTDDGKNILSNIDEGGDKVVNAIHDLIVWSMAKSELTKKSDKITSDKIETAETDVEARQTTNSTSSESSMLSSGVKPLCTYQARISENDKYNSSGKYIATKTNKATAAGILRQDRANYHKFGSSDLEDTGDCLMDSASWRAKFETMLSNGEADSNSIDAIVNGYPLVTVDLYHDSVNVRVD